MKKRKEFHRLGARRGLTLLEILLVLGMMTTLFGMIWGLMALYSRHYVSNENRVGRTQLVRSISQMLDEDLASAVQDPIHPTRRDLTGATAIRRFGLRGDSSSLSIDVVQPNLFAETASPAENIAALTRGGKPAGAQVPELKTIFYEFVPINARQTDDAASGASSGENDSGSRLIGSLETPTPTSSGDKLGAAVPLTRKFGLSRRELDFETPEDSLAADSETGDSAVDHSSPVVGSLASPPVSSFASSESENNLLLGVLAEEESHSDQRPLTAAQIAMNIDDGLMWAPEVVDCRFRYFDGEHWFDRWNSIERSGLPVAIEVFLKLIPLDDVQKLRESPYILRIALDKPDSKSSTDSSRLIGSLASPNDSAYVSQAESRELSLEEAIAACGLTPVMTRRVVAWLPTTPLARHQVVERRRPLPTKEGNVRTGPTGGTGARTVQAESNRWLQDQSVPERQADLRDAETRLAGTRDADQRTASERRPLEHRATERVTAPPSSPLRDAQKREADSRTAQEYEAPKREESQRVERRQTVRDEQAAIDDPYAIGPKNSPAFEPAFVGVGKLQLGPTPFAAPDAAFDSVDSMMSGFEPDSEGTRGRVPDVGGTAVPTQTSRSAQSETGVSQSWIRGNRK